MQKGGGWTPYRPTCQTVLVDVALHDLLCSWLERYLTYISAYI